MELRPLGRTGVSVRKLCLGHTMFGEYGTKDHDESIKIIHRAIDPGITFVDTADVCSQGDSEVIVVGWWQRMRTGATRQRALLHPGRRPRCSRCRSVRPELTGIGAAPQRRANAASERCRSGSPPGRTDVARRDAVTGTSPCRRTRRSPLPRLWAVTRPSKGDHHRPLSTNGQHRRRRATDESTCTPDSVARPKPGGGHPSRPAVAGRLQRPTRRLGRAALERLRRRSPVGDRPFWPCSGWGLPSRAGHPARWWALTPPFHPCQVEPGGLFSVALSRGSPRVAVSNHPALRSPDVPRRQPERTADAAARSTRPSCSV
jgi:hypothetical protein